VQAIEISTGTGEAAPLQHVYESDQRLLSNQRRRSALAAKVTAEKFDEVFKKERGRFSSINFYRRDHGVGIALVVLIPFLRELITDKAETAPVEAAAVVPVA
jgi:hypothetical protein